MPGDTFLTKDNQIFLLTIDFKNSGDKLAYCIKTGIPRWFKSNDVVNQDNLYHIDENNNVIPVKTIHDTPTNIPQVTSVAH